MRALYPPMHPPAMFMIIISTLTRALTLICILLAGPGALSEGGEPKPD